MYAFWQRNDFLRNKNNADGRALKWFPQHWVHATYPAFGLHIMLAKSIELRSIQQISSPVWKVTGLRRMSGKMLLSVWRPRKKSPSNRGNDLSEGKQLQKLRKGDATQMEQSRKVVLYSVCLLVSVLERYFADFCEQSRSLKERLEL